MSYTTDDFAESLERVGIPAVDIEKIISAWGHGEGMGDDAGHYRWADDGATEWSGGFLMKMKAGGFVYVTGWCDYTGWGCQDGAEVYRFETEPTSDEMKAAAAAKNETDQSEPSADEWDIEPADLNKVAH